MASTDDSLVAGLDLHDADTLASLLGTLFEPSDALRHHLVPAVINRASTTPGLNNYATLIDLCAEIVSEWDWEHKALFIEGHPLIGEVKALSAHSAKEQGNAQPTRPAILARLAHLNTLYSTVYPGLRYITFVNGRPRAAIVPELEAAIGIPLSPSPLPDDHAVAQPAADSEMIQTLVHEPEDPEWRAECDRAIADVWRIARARVKAMGLS